MGRGAFSGLGYRRPAAAPLPLGALGPTAGSGSAALPSDAPGRAQAGPQPTHPHAHTAPVPACLCRRWRAAYIIGHAQDCVILADATFAPLLEALLPRIRSCVKHIVLLAGAWRRVCTCVIVCAW